MNRKHLSLAAGLFLWGALGLAPLAAQTAPGTAWRQIDSPHFQIIFPAEIEADARTALAWAEEYHSALKFQESQKTRRWPVVLTTGSMTPNGYVAPYLHKSQWFGTPAMESLGPGDWYQLLAVHEGRHMAQVEQMRRGTLGLGYLLFGNNALAAGFSALPPWVHEGDAVDRETELTSFGRGREPLFLRGMEVVASQDINYYRVKGGSFRQILPDHYEMGYALAKYVRTQYGEEAWGRIYAGTAWLPLPLLGFTVSSLAVTGRIPSSLYKDMIQAEKEETEKSQEYQEHLRAESQTSSRQTSRFYNGLDAGEPGVLYARRWRMDDPTRLVRITSAGEEELQRLPFSGRVSHIPGLTVYVESRPFLLYEFLESSDIILLNHETGQRRVLTRGGRYIDPVIDPETRRIAAVEWTTDRRAILVILSSETGALLQEIPLPQGTFAGWPSFIPQSNKLVLLLQNEHGRALAEVDLAAPEQPPRLLLPFSAESLKNPRATGDSILFSSNLDGTEAIYLLSSEGERKLLVRGPFTLTEPTTDREGKMLSFIEYTGLEGERISQIPLVLPGPEKNLPPVLPQELSPAPPPPAFPDRLIPGDPESFISRPYNPAAHLIRVVNWGPTLTLDETGSGTVPRAQSIGYGLSSQDLLETVTLDVTGRYYPGEQKPGGTLSVGIDRFFPRFQGEVNWTQREIDQEPYQEISSALGFSFPFHLDRFPWWTRLTLEGAVYGRWLIDSSGTAATTFPLTLGFVFSRFLPGSYRDILPDAGLVIQGITIATPLDQENQALHLGIVTGYLPGPLDGTGFKLVVAGETQNSNYQSLLAPPRGYGILPGPDNLFTGGEFHFPLAYPDLALGPLAFIKRLRGSLYAENSLQAGKNYPSLGAQAEIDFTLGDFLPLLSAGIRASYLPEEKKTVIQLSLLGS